ncbi:MAG: hypothetical protein LUI05_00645 [Oscillospiraceae bacterium]|nr:hypothetical protein [Oscillospiraceae bacterium]
MKKRYYIIESEYHDDTYWVIWADLANLGFVPENAIEISRKEAYECVNAARNDCPIDGRTFTSRFICPADWKGNVPNYVQKGCIYDRKP